MIINRQRLRLVLPVLKEDFDPNDVLECINLFSVSENKMYE